MNTNYDKIQERQNTNRKKNSILPRLLWIVASLSMVAGIIFAEVKIHGRIVEKDALASVQEGTGILQPTLSPSNHDTMTAVFGESSATVVKETEENMKAETNNNKTKELEAATKEHEAGNNLKTTEDELTTKQTETEKDVLATKETETSKDVSTTKKTETAEEIITAKEQETSTDISTDKETAETEIINQSNQEDVTDITTENKKYLALTFDDGPSPTVTNRILDVLEDNGAKATFFVMSDRLTKGKEEYQNTVQRAFSLGCQIGNHSYSHKLLTKLSVDQIKYEVEHANELINEIVPIGDAALRPPYGARNKRVYETVKVPMINWSVDTEDWKNRNKDKIVKHILNHAKDGDIVLMHDLYESTAAAVEEVVPRLIEMGYELVTVEELFLAKELSLEGGHLYYKAGEGKTAETDKAIQ